MNIPRYGFLLPLVLPPFVILGWWLGGAWTFLLPVIVWGVLPVVDWLVGKDARNPPSELVAALDRDPLYRWMLCLQVPIVVGLIVWFASAAPSLSTVEFLGPATSVGLVSGGIGIVVAHELGHRHGRVERALSHFLLAWVAYGHFFVEHNKGHHAKVATPEDPATARFGESFWRYFPRSVIGQFRSALDIDRGRTLRSTIGPLAIAVALWSVFGMAAVLFFLLQAFYAVLQLELVNYVEHYGLERKLVAPGRYEKVTVRHSWNSSHRVSNLLLFNLQRHSHHHANQARRYQTLEHYDDSPQLPAGYLAMLPLAMVPPWWHRLMDPRVPRP